MPLRQLDESRKVTAPAKLHENIENAGISVYVTIVVSHDMVVMEVFEDVSGHRFGWLVKIMENEDAHFGNYLFPIVFAHALKVKLLSGENLQREGKNELVVGGIIERTNERTCPSHFRRTLRMIPKEPFPIISRGSYCSRNEPIWIAESVTKS